MFVQTYKCKLMFALSVDVSNDDVCLKAAMLFICAQFLYKLVRPSSNAPLLRSVMYKWGLLLSFFSFLFTNKNL